MLNLFLLLGLLTGCTINMMNTTTDDGSKGAIDTESVPTAEIKPSLTIPLK